MCVMIARLLDGCGPAQRLPNWDVYVSQLCQTQVARAATPGTRNCRQCVSGRRHFIAITLSY